MFFDLLEQFRDRTAVIDENGKSFHYGALLDLGSRFAHLLTPRSLLFHVGSNTFASIAGYVGFTRNGVVPVLINNTISSSLFKELLLHYQPEYLFLPESRVDLMDAGKIIFQENGYVVYQRDNGIHSELNPELSLILTTSGSTGSPKFVRLSEKNLISNAKSIIEYLHIVPQDRALTTLPMTYSYGLSIINSHFAAGASLIVTDAALMERRFWELLKTAKPVTFGGVPYTYEMLKKLRFARVNSPSLRYLTQAGGRLSPELVQEFSQICAGKNIQFVVMYGQTEATARMSYLPPQMTEKKAGSIGIPIPGGTFSLEDEAGNEITSVETPGELIYYGPNVSLGYAETLADLAKGDENFGCLHTGDIAKRDADGYYYIVGRKKRFLKIFGNRVNLDEVERLLKQKGFDAACSGVDDHLDIYLTDVSKADLVIPFLAERTHLNPAAFEVILINSIPRNDSGKILYTELKREGK